jgi:hypothetical protein
MKFKNFRSFGGPARVALTTGHVYLLNEKDWVPIPEFAWADCYANKCMSEDMVTNNSPRLVKEQVETTQNKALARRAAIKDLMYQFRDEQPNFIDRTGYPNMKRLNACADFTITNAERKDIWDEITAELP